MHESRCSPGAERAAPFCTQLRAAADDFRARLAAQDSTYEELAGRAAEALSRAALASVLTSLAAARDVVDAALTADVTDARCDAALRQLAFVRRRAVAAGVLPAQQAPCTDDADAKTDAAAVRSLSLPPAQADKLMTVISALRDQERSPEFHSALRAETHAACSAGGDADTFTFGSTPFATWLIVMSSPPLAEALSRGGEYVVFGSSTGALVLYGRLALGLRSRGYEILPGLAARAEAMRAAHDIDNVELHCVDCLKAPLSRACIVWLCSLCWDAALYDAVQHKLAAELPAGAVVVDYGERLSAAPAFGGTPMWTARLRASWSEQQRFCVYRYEVNT